MPLMPKGYLAKKGQGDYTQTINLPLTGIYFDREGTCLKFFKRNPPPTWINYQIEIDKFTLDLQLLSGFSQEYPLNDPIVVDSLPEFFDERPKLLFARYWDFFNFWLTDPVGNFSVKVQLEYLDLVGVKTDSSPALVGEELEALVIGQLKNAYAPSNRRMQEQNKPDGVITVSEHLTRVELNGWPWYLCEVSGGAHFDKYVTLLDEKHLLSVVFHYSLYNPRHTGWKKEAKRNQDKTVETLCLKKKP